MAMYGALERPSLDSHRTQLLLAKLLCMVNGVAGGQARDVFYYAPWLETREEREWRELQARRQRILALATGDGVTDPRFQQPLSTEEATSEG